MWVNYTLSYFNYRELIQRVRDGKMFTSQYINGKCSNKINLFDFHQN